MASAPTDQKEVKDLNNLSMEEFIEEMSKRYSLVPKEPAPQTTKPTRVEELLEMSKKMTPKQQGHTGPVTSTPAAASAPMFNMEPATSAYVPQTATQASFSQPLTYHPSLPRIPNFSGDSPMPKGEVDYLVWRYEVQCLFSLPGLTSSQVLQIIRGSLRGSARMMIVPLGEQARIEDVLTKLDALYSNAASKEELMTEFFNSVQRPDENVTAFACRLETLLQTIINKGNLPYLARNDLLRHKFWTGLHSDALKMQTRHKYDTVSDYNILLRDIRQVDQELAHRSPSHHTTTAVKHHPVAANDVQQQISSMQSQMESLQTRMGTLEANFETKLNNKFDLMMKMLDEKLTTPSPEPTMPAYIPPQQQQSSQQQYQPQQQNRQQRGGFCNNRGRGYRGQGYHNQGQQHNRPQNNNNSYGRGRGNQNDLNG